MYIHYLIPESSFLPSFRFFSRFSMEFWAPYFPVTSQKFVRLRSLNMLMLLNRYASTFEYRQLLLNFFLVTNRYKNEKNRRLLFMSSSGFSVAYRLYICSVAYKISILNFKKKYKIICSYAQLYASRIDQSN